ncbi:hypothetical protein [Prosthecobacter sp.]|uniref:hypothetical protein n=1 Tax=Prosthecobacter sp. TaxID=1965333 RepID=UPI0037833464
MPSAYLQSLQKAIEAAHGCPCEHQTTGYIHEEMDGETLWKGAVDTFALHGHPTATKAYAWSWKDEDGGNRHVAILNLPPVHSPRTAVQQAIATGQLR